MLCVCVRLQFTRSRLRRCLCPLQYGIGARPRDSSQLLVYAVPLKTFRQLRDPDHVRDLLRQQYAADKAWYDASVAVWAAHDCAPVLAANPLLSQLFLSVGRPLVPQCGWQELQSARPFTAASRAALAELLEPLIPSPGVRGHIIGALRCACLRWVFSRVLSCPFWYGVHRLDIDCSAYCERVVPAPDVFCSYLLRNDARAARFQVFGQPEVCH